MLYAAAAVERAMKVQEVICRVLAGTLTWLQGADILGIHTRSLRRWRARYERDGVLGHQAVHLAAGLADERRQVDDGVESAGLADPKPGRVRRADHRLGADLAGELDAVRAIAGDVPPAVAADTPDPVADAKAFRNFFTQKFPKVKLEDFVNGPYSMNEDLYRQWQEKEQFPPYEFSLEMGKEMFSKPFKNGKTYADCFANGGIGVRQNYPTFDEKEGKVITLELALNRCREANGEQPYSYVKDEMAALTAYMAFTSRGKPMDIKIPDDPRALEAYQNGKRYFYTRRGQLNFSCATCHVQSPGQRIRAEVLAPASDQTAPLFRRRIRRTMAYHRARFDLRPGCATPSDPR